ncbi:MAG: preprotein translocase subunit SecA [Candidatus Peregrinibacteria bacterium]|nr:preprotein translocase subunit SecA [Candidatus Peregrinibacteria bacterium]MDZ4244767.1 preprotein translocase subunit SecA [Candidatus Gracilibacteria bacterium]
MLKLIKKVFGDYNTKELKRISKVVEKINAKEEEYQQILQNDDVVKKTNEFKERIQNGETVDDLLVEAFALVKFACRKLCGTSWDVRGNQTEWNMIPYDVQLIGGIVLHEGKIAEMKTGEGKTMVSTLPMYLNALTEKTCFLVTVNEYLAQRDAEWMGGLYNFLGLSVGVSLNQQSVEEKRATYDCNIIYGTNSEFGFDYLRDNMATDPKAMVQNNLYYAIVDEVDSILVDEARTPLIISAPDNKTIDTYLTYSQAVKELKEDEHYNLDEKANSVALTEEGMNFIENKLGIKSLYDEEGFSDVHMIEQALKAKALFKRDQNYVVKNGEVIIVDEFTGRLMNGRRYSDGLHQAIEAKEGVTIKRESRTLATITLQNYFRIFEKLAGMTGTAATEAEEFSKIYGLEVLVIPTNEPVVRNDMSDAIYKSKAGKYEAVARKVKELHEKGQPVLVGTISIEQSEILSSKLQSMGTVHNVLNAKQHEKEAEIVAGAGHKGSVTIATNMAGRGTDIKLGEGVKELGGLYVIGTERHESRRIDNQLRGRSGRQGDPGASQFYVSVEDDLMRLFGGDKVKSLMERLGVPEDMPIENRFISNSIEGAQKKVEGHHFDIRKHLVEYDDVMNKHREIIYKRRKKFLENEDVKNEIFLLIEKEVEHMIELHAPVKDITNWDFEELLQNIFVFHKDELSPLSVEDLKEYRTNEELTEFIKKYLWEQYQRKEAELPDPAILRNAEKTIGLRVVDTFWMEHIDQMSRLRERVAFSGYAGKDPLLEYKNEAFRMLDEILANISRSTIGHLMHVKIEVRTESATQQQEMHPVKQTEQHLAKPSEQEIIKAPERKITNPLEQAIQRDTMQSAKLALQNKDAKQTASSQEEKDGDTTIRVIQADSSDDDEDEDENMLKPDEKYLPKAKKKKKKKR